MSDPVTLSTGITYDRHHIHHWLFSLNRHTCPVTNQILPVKLLTPNLTLRRLIQSLSTAETSPVDSMARLGEAELAELAEPSATCLDFLASVITASRAGEEAEPSGKTVEESLEVLNRLKLSDSDLKKLGSDAEFVDSLEQIMARSSNRSRSYAAILLRSVFRFSDPIRLVNARSEIFAEVVSVLNDRICDQATKAALKFLIEVCPWGRNRIKAVEGGAVKVLIELLMEESGNRRTEEMAVRAVEVMCGCAEGRAELVGHAAGMAVVAKKILRVSHAATERAVRILSAVSRYSSTGRVVAEMLEVGVVAKLCLVVQVDASWKSKEKAREILRKHSRAWRSSPCIPSELISSFPI
ncbi:E3 ubiquitin-protein ligase PUB23 [Linum perenne]